MGRTEEKLEITPEVVERAIAYLKRRGGKRVTTGTALRHGLGVKELPLWTHRLERELSRALKKHPNAYGTHTPRGYREAWCYVSDEKRAKIEEGRRKKAARDARRLRLRERVYDLLVKLGATPADADDWHSDLVWRGALIGLAQPEFWTLGAEIKVPGVGEFRLSVKALGEVAESGGGVVEAFAKAMELAAKKSEAK